MERGKRLLVLLLSVLMVVSQMSVSAFAFAEGQADPEETKEVSEEQKETKNDAPEVKDADPAPKEEVVQEEKTGGEQTEDTAGTGSGGMMSIKSVDTTTGKFSITNSTNGVIVIKGKIDGGNFRVDLKKGGTKDLENVQSLDSIYATEPVYLTGYDLDSNVVTRDEGDDFPYCLEFTDKSFTTDVTVTVRTDTSKVLVRFFGNGGSGSMNPQVFTVEHAKALYKCAFKKDESSFLGWASGNRYATTAQYTDGKSISFEKNIGGSVLNFYAVWHQHNWVAEKTGTKQVKIVCSVAGCPIEPVTIKMNAAAATYDGNDYDGLTLTGDEDLPEGFSVAATEFYQGGKLIEGAPVNAGSYTVKVPILKGSAVFATLEDSFTINPIALKVKADNKEKVYGEEDPVLTYKAEGLLDGDKKQDVFEGSLARDEGDDADGYYIRQGSLTVIDSNYTLAENDFTNGVLTINPAPATIEEAPAALSRPYDGTEKDLITAGKAGNGFYMRYALEGDSSFSPDIPKAAARGTYVVKYKAIPKNDDKNHTASEEGMVSVNITDPTITPPVEKKNLTYNGEEQELITAGSTDSGEMKYCLYKLVPDEKSDTGYDEKEVTGWGVAVPKIKDAGQYKVYWVVKAGNERLDGGFVLSNIAAAYRRPEVSMEDFTYGKYEHDANKPTLSYAGDETDKGEVTWSYKKAGDESFTVIESNSAGYPLSKAMNSLGAGDYVLRVDITESNNYQYGSAMDSFTIKKAPYTDIAGLKVEAIENTYTGNPLSLVKVEPSPLPDGVSIQFKKSPRGEYADDVKATDAGTYDIWYKVNGGQNYTSKTPGSHSDADFQATIKPANVSGIVDVKGWNFGEYDKEQNGPSIKDVQPASYDTSKVSYVYASCEGDVAPADESAYSDEFPVNAGKYAVKAVFPGSKNYKRSLSEATTFEITKGSLKNLAVSLDDWTYGQKAKEPVVTGNTSGTEATFKYYTREGEGQEARRTEITGFPETAGKYSVRATVPDNPNTGKTIAWDDFEILKANPFKGLTIEEWKFGEFNADVNAPVLQVAEGYTGTVKYQYAELGDKKVEELTDDDYKPADGASLADIVQVFSSLGYGRYAVRAILPEDGNYKAVTTDAEAFRVTEGSADYDESKLPVAASGLVYNGKAQTLFAAMDQATYDYWTKHEGDNHLFWAVSKQNRHRPDSSEFKEFTSGTTVPQGENAGPYYVWLKVKNPNRATANVTPPLAVTIAKADITGLTVSINAWNYGDPANKPSLNKEVEGSVFYKYNGTTNAGDSYSSDKAPKEAGLYTVTATVSETANYNKAEVESASFRVYRAVVNLKVTADDWTYGETAKAPVVEGNVGGGALTYEYSGKNSKGEEYQGESGDASVQPGDAGSYTVKVTAAETYNYVGAEAEDTFTIAQAETFNNMTIDDWAWTADGANVQMPTFEGLPSEIEMDKIKYKFVDLAVVEKDVDSLTPDDFTDEWKNAEALRSAFEKLDVGDYAVIANMPDSVNYKAGCTDAVAFSVTTGSADYDPSMLPTAVRGLKYNSADQALVSLTEDQIAYWFGTGNNGNVLYWAVREQIGPFPPARPRESSFTKMEKDGDDITLPTGKGLGTYYVWFRVENENTQSAKVRNDLVVRIGKGDLTNLKVEISNWVYKGTASTPVVTGNDSDGRESIRYTGTTVAGKSYSDTTAPTWAGDYKVTVYVAETGHYNSGSASCDFKIGKADAPEPTKAPAAKADLKYTGKAQALITAGEGYGRGVMKYKLGEGEFTTDIPTAIEADTYNVQYFVDYPEDSNYKDSEVTTIEASIAKGDAEYIAPKAKTGLTYSGSALALVTEGSSEEGSFQYKLSTEQDYGDTVPEGTAAGNYVVDYKFVGDKDHKDATGSVNVTISAKEASVVWEGTNSFRYDSKEHSVADNAKSINGLVAGDTVNIKLGGDVAKTEVGKYIATASLDGEDAGNYRLTSGTNYAWEIVQVNAASTQVSAAEIAWKGTYSAAVPAAKSVKAKAAKKAFTVKWKKLKKKQLKQFTNVEVQYCTDGAFNMSTTAVKMLGKGKKSVKVKGLAKGSVYYVRVRNISNAGGTKYASAWSGVKRVKVK